MMSLMEWLEAVSTQYYWSKEPNPVRKGDRDPLFGMPRPERLGFSDTDRMQLEKSKDEVENYLNKITDKWGIHWLLLYVEPKKGSVPSGQEDATNGFGTGKSQWDVYEKMTNNIASRKATKFMQENGLDPRATIVYVKQGSRVHGLSTWQQLHNIGHAVFNAATRHKAEFAHELQNCIATIQQKAHSVNPSEPPPSPAEITVVLGRLLNNQSLQRLFTLGQGSLDKPQTLVNTGLNSFDELIYDLLASFLRNGGKINLKPRGNLVDVRGRTNDAIDRRGDLVSLPARGEIDRYLQKSPVTPGSPPNPLLPAGTHRGTTRDWVWKPILNDQAVCRNLAANLEEIIHKAIMASTYGNYGGPIHATPGYLTYDP